MTANPVFEVKRNELEQTRISESSLPALAAGQIRLRVDRFALTANTVTYALTGDLLGYWNFYPGASEGWGRVPAMGWGEVVESGVTELAVGSRYYGWLPMSPFIDIQASPTAEGFRDDGPHRQAHAPIYRSFPQTDRDPLYQPGQDAEDRHALLRGLMATAFLADDYLAEQEFFGAEQVMLLSASSKTAIALAELLAARPGLTVLGATSARNKAFVESLGCYGQTLSYEELDGLPASTATVVVDMAGNNAVLNRVHEHYGEALKYSMAIGRSHHDAEAQRVGGAVKPQFFFAPSQAKKRTLDWGGPGLTARLRDALHAHVARSEGWLKLEEIRGLVALQQAWTRMLAGEVAPDQGLIVVPGGG